MAKQAPFTMNRLLLCEGTEDAGFLRALIAHRGLGAIDVRPVVDLGKIGGTSGFSPALIASVVLRDFRKVNSLGLVIDCDQHHRTSFDTLCEQIRIANQNPDVGGRFEIPAAPLIPTGGHPRLTVIMMPKQRGRGGLETLLWESIQNTAAYASARQATDDACNTVGIQRWGRSKHDKARIRVLVALLYRKNPALALARLWTEEPSLIPIDSPVFDDLAQAIARMP